MYDPMIVPDTRFAAHITLGVGVPVPTVAITCMAVRVDVLPTKSSMVLYFRFTTACWDADANPAGSVRPKVIALIRTAFAIRFVVLALMMPP